MGESTGQTPEMEALRAQVREVADARKMSIAEIARRSGVG